MEQIYLIEIRLGRTKWRIKQEIAAFTSQFGLEAHRERHPHVTIFGPLFLNPDTSEQQLLTVLGEICGRYGPIPFLIDGWEKREGMHGSVIAFSVRPSEPLSALTREIAGSLLPLCESLNIWDPEPDTKWFHVTVANHLDPHVAATTWDHIAGNPPHRPRRFTQLRDWLHGFINGTRSRSAMKFRPLLLDETGLRLTVMKGEEILAEYDFSEKKWTTTGNDHAGVAWQKALRAYRKAAMLEQSNPVLSDADEIYVISDLHLGHANIIRYCSRPFLFSDPDEMDSVLINNWNSVAGSETPIFHLGDLRYGSTAQPAPHYLKKLQGKITLIRGNHDEDQPDGVMSSQLEYDGLRFFLVHDPADAPPQFPGWVIHGHHHNNDLRSYPFINFTDQRVNVSAEVTGYVPVSLREICSRIREHMAAGTDTPILLRYPHVSLEERP